MKKQRLIRHILVFTIIFALLFQSTALAITPSGDSSTLSTITTESSLTEVVSLREESIKTFRKPDGGYVAAIYGEAVHYQDSNGVWQEIDNTFSSTSMTQSQLVNAGIQALDVGTAPVAYYQNIKNPFQVNLPNTLNSNVPVTVSCQGHTLGFALQNAAVQTASVAASASKSAELTAESTSIRNTDGILTYADVFPHTQLVYEMRGRKLKESFVFSKPPTQSDYTFRFYYTGLFPQLLSTGEVRFYDNAEFTENPIFIVDAPYMFDSGDGYSNDVTVTLEQVANGCLYTLTPDQAWLNDSKRVYPVTLDPSISDHTPLEQTKIHDNSVHQSDLNKNYRDADRLYVGSVVLSSGIFESRTYIKFPRITSIPTSAFILKATMNLTHHTNTSYQSGSNNTFLVYDCGNNIWDTNTITWSSQANFSFTNLICSAVSNKSDTVENFDVTALVRQWYSTTASNNGLVIKPETVHRDVSNRTAYYSSDISSSIQAKRPHIEVEYYNDAPPSGFAPNAAYFIRSVYSGKYITVPSNGGSQTYLTQQDFTGASCQKFQAKYVGGGVYTLIPQHNTSLRIDVSNGFDQNGNDLWVYTANDTAAQYFRIIANGDGSYRLMPLNSTTRVVDIEGPSTANGARIQIWTWSSSANQMKWYFESANSFAQMRIYSTDSTGILGHAFLVFKNTNSFPITIANMIIPAGSEITMGTFAALEELEHGGVWVNLETVRNPNYFTTASMLTTTLKRTDITIINNYVISNNTWALNQNCTNFSSGLWNSISDITLSPGIANTPAQLKASIEEQSGYTGGILVTRKEPIGYFNTSGNFVNQTSLFP